MPTISVIVPVYNAEKYIYRCVESILAQTFDDFEVLLVNDGSKDNSRELCNQLAAKDARVKVFHRENNGASAARCFGVKQSCGKYINFVDADDSIPSDSLELLFEKASRYQLDIVQGTNTFFITENDTFHSLLGKEGILNNVDFCQSVLRHQCNIGPCCSLYKKELFSDKAFNLEPIIKLNEDKYMNLCLGAKANKAGLFNDIMVYNYYKNETSTTHSYAFESTEPFRLLYKHMKEVLSENELLDLLESDLYISELSTAFICCMHNKKLLHDEWTKQVLNDTNDIALTLSQKLLRGLLLHPTLYPFYFSANNIRRFFGRLTKRVHN